MLIIAALNARSSTNKYGLIFSALYNGNKAGIANKKVVAPAPSNCAKVPIIVVTTATIIILPRVNLIIPLTKGLNKPLSEIIPK